jgi:hypothetical protein
VSAGGAQRRRVDNAEHGSTMNRAMVGGRTIVVSTYPVGDQVGPALRRRLTYPRSFFRVFHRPPIPYPGVPQWGLEYLADPEGNLVELVSRR